jgi:hypothetical protein
MKTACAVVVVGTIATTIRIDAQWVADVVVAGACTGGVFVAFASIKWT